MIFHWLAHSLEQSRFRFTFLGLHDPHLSISHTPAACCAQPMLWVWDRAQGTCQPAQRLPALYPGSQQVVFKDQMNSAHEEKSETRGQAEMEEKAESQI